MIGIFNIPPGLRAFGAHIADELVRRLHATASNGIAPLAGKSIVDSLLISLEVSDQLVDLLSRLGIWWLQPLEAPDDPAAYFTPEEPATVASHRSGWRAGRFPNWSEATL